MVDCRIMPWCQCGPCWLWLALFQGTDADTRPWYIQNMVNFTRKMLQESKGWGMAIRDPRIPRRCTIAPCVYPSETDIVTVLSRRGIKKRAYRVWCADEVQDFNANRLLVLVVLPIRGYCGVCCVVYLTLLPTSWLCDGINLTFV